MSPDDDKGHPRRKRRTREHIIEDLSENHLERKVLLKGHLLRRPERDYGVDVTMFHFGEGGAIENGEVRFQLKATDRLRTIKQGTIISIPIKTGDLHYWALELYPFVLVVFDTKSERAFWIHIQEYVRRYPGQLESGKETVNIRIPASNKLTEKSIETFRDMSIRMVEKLRNQGGFPDARQKPK